MDIRERLTVLGKAPSMGAVTREGILCQVMTWLLIGGADWRDILTLERYGVPDTHPRNLVAVDHLMKRIEIPTDPWAQGLVEAALKLLPDPCIVNITR